MTVATAYGSLTTDQASVKPDGNPVCTSLHYPHFLAGQTEASELIDLPKVTQLVGLEARINTQMCLVPEPSWGHQALKLGAKGRRVGGWGGVEGVAEVGCRVVGIVTYVLCGPLCPCQVGLTLSSSHMRKLRPGQVL